MSKPFETGKELNDFIDEAVKEARVSKDADIIKARDELDVALAKHNREQHPLVAHYEKVINKLNRKNQELECELYKLKNQVASGWIEGVNK